MISVFDRSLKCVLSTVPPTPTVRRAWKLEILTADGARWRKGEKLWTLSDTCILVCFIGILAMPLWVVDEKKQRVKEGKTKSFRSPTFKVVQNEPPCLNDVIRCCADKLYQWIIVAGYLDWILLFPKAHGFLKANPLTWEVIKSTNFQRCNSSFPSADSSIEILGKEKNNKLRIKPRREYLKKKTSSW
jgi:hypothetical protein